MSGVFDSSTERHFQPDLLCLESKEMEEESIQGLFLDILVGKCLPCKHKELKSISNLRLKSQPGMKASVCNLSAGEVWIVRSLGLAG